MSGPEDSPSDADQSGVEALDVSEVRAHIDALDLRLLELLDRRARLALRAGELKRSSGKAIHDPERETKVFERLEQALEGLPAAVFPARSVRPVFREVISACLALEQPLSVAYLGPPGTFSHMAAKAAFGVAMRYVDTSTIAGVFDAVMRKEVTYGVVPIENSTEGGVTFTLDSLIESDVRIRQEIVIEVAHCVVSRSPELASVRKVFTHPQPLGQCRAWLNTNLPHAEIVLSSSTAAAARLASEEPGSAAISSRLAAELHGLTILRADIQDKKHNATRFLVIGEQDAPPTGSDRTSIVFSAPHEQGALRRSLEIFDDAGINLSRIESRPAGKLWEYVFFVDLEGHRSDENVKQAIKALTDRAAMLKVLGSYPRSAS
ncbi:MAG: prephenate dehydratase [Polyangiaceae bacterium]|nr:prephenate dehydratase [Myxococcales bacterium]MCB9590325.1 prephenate dehydratase [Polyangiaceae bacterium]MCB9605020.1 prephenate dehydratase [Polyangiaceae bacterium]